MCRMATAYHSSMVFTKNRTGNGEVVKRAIASSTPSRNVRMMTRAFVSQANQSRSSKMDCMPVRSSFSEFVLHSRLAGADCSPAPQPCRLYPASFAIIENSGM